MPTDAAPRKLYAIMRFAKIKSFTTLARVCAHNTRTVHSENVREGAPPPKELLETGSDDFVASAHALLGELGIDRASTEGKVLAIETVTTASRGWFEKATDDERQQWLDANVAWARKKFGRGLLTAKLHLDEEVWHIHFVALPAVEKLDAPRGARPKDPAKRADYERRKATAAMRWTLSYHDVLGGTKQRFSLEQDAYHAAVLHLGLERGEIQRDDIEIELGDELTTSALALSRGRDADGIARPRRSMTPAEGRAAVKRLRREAELARRAAEEERRQAQAEHAAAIAARAEAARAQAEREALLDRRAEDADVRERETAEALAAARVAKAVAEQARADMEAALLAATGEREAAAAQAIQANKMRIDAETERTKAAAERDAAAAARAKLDGEHAVHAAQLALLARAADDDSVLRLRATEGSLSMNKEAMTEDERGIFGKPWSTPLIRIAHQLVRMLEEVRDRARRLVAREIAVSERDAALTAKEQSVERNLVDQREAQRRVHEAAMADLDRREATLRADEKRAANLVADAETRIAEAEKRRVSADAELSRMRRWSMAVDAIDRHPNWVDLTDAATIRLDPGIAAAVPPDLVATLREHPPLWALSIITQRLDLAESIKLADEHERQAAYAAERLTDMVKKAGPVLTPIQQEVAAEVARVARQWKSAQGVDRANMEM